MLIPGQLSFQVDDIGLGALQEAHHSFHLFLFHNSRYPTIYHPLNQSNRTVIYYSLNKADGAIWNT